MCPRGLGKKEDPLELAWELDFFRLSRPKNWTIFDSTFRAAQLYLLRLWTQLRPAVTSSVFTDPRARLTQLATDPAPTDWQAPVFTDAHGVMCSTDGTCSTWYLRWGLGDCTMFTNPCLERFIFTHSQDSQDKAVSALEVSHLLLGMSTSDIPELQLND